MKLSKKMSIKVTFSLEPLFTPQNGAFERLFPSMRSHMGLKVSTFGKLLATCLAFIGLVTRMPSQMNFESTGALKFRWTEGTQIRALPSMSSDVINQMTLSSKALLTVFKFTFIGTLPRVNSNVGIEISFLKKLFSTVETLKWTFSIMLFLMMSKGTQTCE